jgi:hypothetical protein
VLLAPQAQQALRLTADELAKGMAKGAATP